MAHIQMRMDADATAAAGDDGVSYKITLMEKFALFRKDRFINICRFVRVSFRAGSNWSQLSLRVR